MIYRYSPVIKVDDGSMLQDPNGEYVRLEDHNNEVRRLKILIATYRNIPYPCHYFMTKEHWIDICNITAEVENQ